MLQSFQRAFTRQAIQRPKQQHIELALRRVLEHAPEPSAVGVLACNLVNVFENNVPAQRARKLSQLYELIVCLLLARANSRINSASHFVPPVFFFAQRARAAFLARLDRSALVLFFAAIAPPAPPRQAGQ
jgi:hypothetical protein